MFAKRLVRRQANTSGDDSFLLALNCRKGDLNGGIRGLSVVSVGCPYGMIGRR